MSKRKVLIVLLLLVATAVGLLAQRGGQKGTEGGARSGTTVTDATPTPTQRASSASSQGGTDAWLDGAEERPDSLHEAVWDESAVGSALVAAETALAAFDSDEELTDRWRQGLLPLLTPTAQQVYSLWSRSLIPELEITGPATVSGHISPLLATVGFPTEGEQFCVLLVRLDGASPWLVEAFAWESELP